MKRLNRLALMLRSQAVVFTQILHRHLLNTLIFFAALLTASKTLPQSDSKPTLTIPLGSYLKDINLANMYFSNRSIDLKGSVRLTESYKSYSLSFESNATFPDAESCWAQGYDLTTGEESDLACDTARSVPVIKDNAARFLYSVLVPHGNYLYSCTGLLATREGDTTYLYASCMQSGGGTDIISSRLYKPNRLNITSCNGEIVNNRGRLECSNSSGTPRKVLSGSYLANCDLSQSVYNVIDNRLDTNCDGRKLALENASNCIGSGKDIVFRGFQVVCVDNPDKQVREHTASPFLPPGNYLLTCTHLSFFPCMGPEIMRSGTMTSVKAGLLSARCATQFGIFTETRLEDADQECRMSEMGYVSNVDGGLICDRDIKFNEDEYPTLGTDLKPHFQCDQ